MASEGKVATRLNVICSAVIAVIACIGIVVTAVRYVDSRFDEVNLTVGTARSDASTSVAHVEATLNQRIDKDELDQRLKIKSLEDAIRVLQSRQPASAKDIIDRLMGEAHASLSAGKPSRAEKARQVASTILSVQKPTEEITPAFFSRTSASIQGLSAAAPQSQLVEQSIGTLSTLAALRSKFGKQLEIQDSPYTVSPDTSIDAVLLHFSSTRATIFQASGYHEIYVQNPAIPDTTFVGIVFARGIQRLDHLILRNVVFVGVHIIYDGGPLSMNDVRFFDCTFEGAPKRQVLPLLNYAANDSRGEFFAGD